jgi:hypothetical protein
VSWQVAVNAFGRYFIRVAADSGNGSSSNDLSGALPTPLSPGTTTLSAAPAPGMLPPLSQSLSTLMLF